MLSGKDPQQRGRLERTMNAACKALLLVESDDLEIEISLRVDSFFSVQETLDIYSIQDNILELK